MNSPKVAETEIYTDNSHFDSSFAGDSATTAGDAASNHIMHHMPPMLPPPMGF